MSRRRWVYTSGGEPLPEPIEVTDDFTGAERRAQVATEELTYGGVTATDGTPINTRKKHREYLASRGMAMASDYSPEYLQKRRDDVQRELGKDRKETIIRAYEMTAARKRK